MLLCNNTAKASRCYSVLILLVALSYVKLAYLLSVIFTVQRSHNKQAYLALLNDPLDGIRHHVGVIFQAATQYSSNQQKHEDDTSGCLRTETRQAQKSRIKRSVSFLQDF